MKTLYIDCGMGAAGDMLAAALLELMPDPDAALARLNAFGIHGVAYARERKTKAVDTKRPAPFSQQGGAPIQLQRLLQGPFNVSTFTPRTFQRSPLNLWTIDS